MSSPHSRSVLYKALKSAGCSCNYSEVEDPVLDDEDAPPPKVTLVEFVAEGKTTAFA